MANENDRAAMLKSSFKILLVDHDEISRGLINQILTGKGFKVTSCDCGTMVLERCHLLEPDLLLTSMTLPDIDGIQLAEKMKIHIPNLLIVVMIESSERFAYSSVIHGASGVIEKPFSFDRFSEKLRFLHMGR